MNIMHTVFLYCIEDDAKLVSAFFMDLGNLISSQQKNVRVIARYRSYFFYKSFDMILDGMHPVKIKPIKSINYTSGVILSDIVSFLKKYKSMRSPTENSFVLQSHGYDGYIYLRDRCDTQDPRCYGDQVTMDNLVPKLPWTFDAIFLDACCMSTVETLRPLRGATKYVVACQYTCPWLGIASESFLPILGSSKPLAERLTDISQAFIARNSKRNRKWREVSDKTDSVVVDMILFGTFLDAYDAANPCLKRMAKHRIVVYKGYFIYDLYGLLMSYGHRELTSLLKRAVVGHAKTHVNMKNKGISLGVNTYMKCSRSSSI